VPFPTINLKVIQKVIKHFTVCDRHVIRWLNGYTECVLLFTNPSLHSVVWWYMSIILLLQDIQYLLLLTLKYGDNVYE